MKSESHTFTYTPFIPLEIDHPIRKDYYMDDGSLKYVVEVDPDTKRYVRQIVRLITDPAWVTRLAYVLYDATEVEYMDWESPAGFVIDKINFVAPDRVHLIKAMLIRPIFYKNYAMLYSKDRAIRYVL